MIKIALEYTYYVDIIQVSERIAKDIKKYQALFDKWLYNKTNDHGHWILIDGKKRQYRLIHGIL